MGNIITWWSAHAAAIGLLLQAGYLFTQGNYSTALTTLLAALAAFGIGQSVQALREHILSLKSCK